MLGLQVPILGVCLGAQLLAKAAHADVGPSAVPEVGWHPVELTEDARDDPLFGSLPARFDAFQWHYYTYAIPAGAVELAASPVCTQAFRLGERVWGIQFHAEVTDQQIQSWVDEDESEVPVGRETLMVQTRDRIAEWNELGRRLCSSFLEVADRVGAPA
jgi:GMP synthase-like glutamine amidotransferase